MARKKHANARNQVIKGEKRILKDETDRGEEIMNVIVNTSVILMSTMMGAFTAVILNTTGAMASGMAEALGGKEAEEKVNKELKQKLPEVDEKMKTLISDVRKDIYAQFKQKSKDTEPLFSDPLFDVGPKIIDKYDFKLPSLTEELDDSALAQYAQLLISGEPGFAEMFKELTSWMNTLPKFPGETNKE